MQEKAYYQAHSIEGNGDGPEDGDGLCGVHTSTYVHYGAEGRNGLIG